RPSPSSPPVGGKAAPRDVKHFWTPDRLRNANPVETHPRPRPDGLPEGAQTGAAPAPPTAPPQRGEGSPPQVNLESGAARQLLRPRESALLEQESMWSPNR